MTQSLMNLRILNNIYIYTNLFIKHVCSKRTFSLQFYLYSPMIKTLNKTNSITYCNLTPKLCKFVINNKGTIFTGIGVTFAKMISQVTGFQLNFPKTRTLGIGSDSVVEWLEEKLNNLRSFGYILCTTTLTDKLPIHFIRSYYLLSDSLIWILPIPPAYAQWENIAFVFKWQTWCAILFVLIMQSVFLWYFYEKTFQQSFFNVFLIQLQLILGKWQLFAQK